MKWKLTPLPIRKLGDRRTITRFAFLPVEINGEMVWLERYPFEQVWTIVYRTSWLQELYNWQDIRLADPRDYDYDAYMKGYIAKLEAQDPAPQAPSSEDTK